ncbi:hypothetical protein D9M71_140560 [compost metagenome]
MHGAAATVAEGDGAGLVQHQYVHIPRRFHRPPGLGDHIQAHQAVHAGDADGRQQAADGGGDQRHQQRHQEHQRQRAIGEMREGLQRHHHQQKDQGQADQQDIQGDFVGSLLPFGTFDQGDHAVQGRLAGVGADLHQQPVGHQPGVAGDGRTIATGLTNHRRGLTGNRRLVDRRDALDHLAVAGDHFTGDHAHNIPLAQAAGSHLFIATQGVAPLRSEPLAAGLEAVGTGLAATFGQGFGKVGEQHGEP